MHALKMLVRTGAITEPDSMQSQPKCESNPRTNVRNLSTITTTLCSLQQCNDKMSYLNQMYEKKAMARA